LSKSTFERRWIHDRDHVRLLHGAHADQIEAEYRALRDLPGNPEAVVLQQIGPVRTLIASGNRFENRAIFTGEETNEQIDAVLRHFADHRSNCVIEINIANSYVDPPRSWEARLLKHLLTRGCRPHGMRCVWYRDLPPTPDERNFLSSAATASSIIRFESEQIDKVAALVARVDMSEWWSRQRQICNPRAGLFHYVAFDGEHPCAFGSLVVNKRIGYLAYWHTKKEYRGRGLHLAGVIRRISDAFDLGCELVFSVSDFNFASPYNLQKCGFGLAYNYLLVTREANDLPAVLEC
jgi:hypothetical protein